MEERSSTTSFRCQRWVARKFLAGGTIRDQNSLCESDGQLVGDELGARRTGSLPANFYSVPGSISGLGQGALQPERRESLAWAPSLITHARRAPRRTGSSYFLKVNISITSFYAQFTA